VENVPVVHELQEKNRALTIDVEDRAGASDATRQIHADSSVAGPSPARVFETHDSEGAVLFCRLGEQRTFSTR